MNFTRTLELSQLVKEPTRATDTSRTTIDLIFVNNEHRFVDDGVIPQAISDHYLVYCILKVGMPKGSPRVVEYRSYKKYNLKIEESQLGIKIDKKLKRSLV